MAKSASTAANRRNKKSAMVGRFQRGAALLIFIILVVMGSLTYVVRQLSPDMIDIVRQKHSEVTLLEAQEALISYMLGYRERQVMQDLDSSGNEEAVMYGYLPMPDMGSVFNQNEVLANPACTGEGCATLNQNPITTGYTYIGRFPWKSIGTPVLRDGAGECLWYAVSASHREPKQNTAIPMNWDTIGQLDVVQTDTTGTGTARGLTNHDRPLAIIIAPGKRVPLNTLTTTATADIVSQCGGNYVPGDHLEYTTLGPNPFNTTTAVGGDTSSQAKPIASQGRVVSINNSTQERTTVANDYGLPVTADNLFRIIRSKNTNFRSDINYLLDRIISCLRDEFYTGSTPGSAAKIAGADNNACYGTAVNPLGYYPNYREMLFVASSAISANGNSACAGALVFASQRGTNPLTLQAQVRDSATTKAEPANYLEGINYTSYSNSGTTYSGPEQFSCVSSTHSAAQDIVRCIPPTPSFASTTSPGLTAAGFSQLTSYNPATQTLSLGQTITSVQSTALNAANAAKHLYGCSWRPETHAMGGGLRSYFTFRIDEPVNLTTAAHEGITFAIVDGDTNGIDACGAAGQHQGFSGNNTTTPYIAAPKIGFEIDPRREGTFNPNGTNTLTNGRNDPSTVSTAYRGGHVALTYWGGETAIATTAVPPCVAPRIDVGGVCYLPAEEDDNVHGQATNTRSGFPTPPANPSAPTVPLSVPPDTPAGVYKLDPSRSQVPVSPVFFHVRIELTRETANYTLPTARVASTANLNLTSPGSAIDGVYLFAGDRVLVKDQTTGADNGLYVWNSATTAMTRATDATSSADLAGLVVAIEQGGLHAKTLWRQAVTNAVVGTDTLRWHRADVKLVAPATTNLSSPGAMLDGVIMKVGDRVLVQNTGLYLWQGAAVAMTLSGDSQAGTAVQVRQGSEATAWWRHDGTGWVRQSVIVATQAALNLSAPGATIDSVALTSGDRVLVRMQGNLAENGVYVWNGAASTMTRTTDADTAAELSGSLMQVIKGTDAGRTYRQTTLPSTGTLNSTSVQWSAIDASPRYMIEVWILPDSGTTANQIAAMKNTTRAMSTLYPGFTAHLRDAPTIPYPFRNVRVGFTTGQRTTVTDQTFTVTAPPPTWIE
jgi:hypothetical protein